MPVFAVTTAKGANWDHAREIREQPFWDQHAAFAEGLVDPARPGVRVNLQPVRRV